MGLRFSTIHPHSHDELPFESSTTAANTLISRTILTNIIVCTVMTSDLEMSNNSRLPTLHNAARPREALAISPLYDAVQRNDLEFVENMFSNLAMDDNVLRTLNKGKSILRLAIGHNHREMVETILKYQPKLIECTDEEGLTSLSYAASKGLVDIVSYIINKYPKSITIRNKDMTDSYPIHKACVGCHIVVLKMIHAKNPDTIRSLDKDGNTIMHIAAKTRGNKLKTVVSFLLELNQGRELLKKKDENGFTPLQLAINSRNRDVQEIIQKAMPL